MRKTYHCCGPHLQICNTLYHYQPIYAAGLFLIQLLFIGLFTGVDPDYIRMEGILMSWSSLYYLCIPGSCAEAILAVFLKCKLQLFTFSKKAFQIFLYSVWKKLEMTEIITNKLMFIDIHNLYVLLTTWLNCLGWKITSLTLHG